MATGNYDATINVQAKVDEGSIKQGIANGIKGGVQKGSKDGEGILGRTVRQMGNRVSLTIAQGIIDGFKRGMADAVRNVKELNDAQTEFKKVSELNGKALDEYTAKAAQMGKEVGRSGREMIEAATEFRKSNFGDADSLGLARIASLYQNIADEELNAADASSFIISQLKAGFKDINSLGSDTEKATYAINALNEVSNNFAVSSSDLSKNISKTSAAMATGNVTYAQTLGMMTGMTEVTRSATTSATSLTRVQSRFNQILDDSSTTGKKLTEWYGEHGIKIRDEEGNLRSLYKVLKDVSKRWDELSEDERKYFALIQGSATQSNRLMALMTNYKTTIDAVKAAKNSENSATEENAKYQESLAYALSELNAAWEKLSTDLISSGFLTDIVNMGTDVINFFDKLVNDMGALPALFTTVTTAVIGFKGAFSGFKSIGSLMDKMFEPKKNPVQIVTQLSDVWKQYSFAGMNLNDPKNKQFVEQIKNARKELGLTRKEAEVTKRTLINMSPSSLGKTIGLTAEEIAEISKSEEAVTELSDTWKKYSFASMNLNDPKSKQFAKEIKDARKELNLTRKEAEVAKKTLIEASPELMGTTIGGGDSVLKKTEEILSKINDTTEDVTESSASAGISVAKILGSLKMILPVLATIAVIIGSIEIDKYFSFESSLERLDEYKDKLKDVQNQIDVLKEKRDNDGLTNAEKTHLAVLEAEERSLERQIKLEQQRIQNAFKRDISTKQGKKYQERTGPTQLLDYQDSRKKELDLDNKILEKKEQIADAEKKAQFYRMHGDEQGVATWEEQADAYSKQLDEMYEQYVKLDAEAAEASSNLGLYWEQVSSSVNYDKLSDVEKEKFDEIHKAFIESQIDATKLKDSYKDVSSVINNAMNSLGHDNLNLFDNIDISSIQTVEDAVDAIKEQINSLDDDTEITFSVKDKDGNVKEFTKKVSEITDKNIEAIVHFNTEGTDEVESDADKASRTRESVVKVIEEGAQGVSNVIDDASKDRTANVKVTDNNTANDVQDDIDDIKGKSVHINIFKTIWESIVKKKSATGKRKGEQGGLSWLGDEGTAQNPKPELVVSEDGAYLAGTQGWELRHLEANDIVYTATQTKKLLNGKQSFYGSADELPRYKKGKLSAKQKAKRDKKRKEFDKKLEKLEHKRKVKHWTDEKFEDEYKALYKKYKKWLKKDKKWERSESREDYENKFDTEKFKTQAENIVTESDFKQFAKDVQASSNLSTDEKNELIKDAKSKYYSSEFDRQTGILSKRGDTNGSLNSLVSQINTNDAFSESEKHKYIVDAYKTVAEYNLKAYKNGEKTREETLKSITEYYNKVGKEDETYYQMLDELREEDKEKELKRLEELQDAHTNSLSLAEKYVKKELDAVNQKIEANKKEADTLEKLIELQNDLVKARSTKVRVYKEGIGFVYERDTKAVEDAEKALSEYKSTLEKTPLERQAEYLQSILDLFGEIEESSAIKELELLLGVSGISSLTGLTTGSSLSDWSKWISERNASSAGYADLRKQLENASSISDINADSETTISDAIIQEYIRKHSFARGTLSASGGLSMVAEHLKGELVWLGKGDSVYSNAVSRNLMEWGQYSPNQIIKNTQSGTNQVFNFDKLVLPNVHNAQDFYEALKNLPNQALQQSNMRI